MGMIAQTIYKKYTAHPEVGKKARVLLRLALGELDEVYQDEMLAAADERQQLQTRLTEALDRVRELEAQSASLASAITLDYRRVGR